MLVGATVINNSNRFGNRTAPPCFDHQSSQHYIPGVITPGMQRSKKGFPFVILSSSDLVWEAGANVCMLCEVRNSKSKRIDTRNAL
jgi:hypothetical protein